MQAFIGFMLAPPRSSGVWAAGRRALTRQRLQRRRAVPAAREGVEVVLEARARRVGIAERCGADRREVGGVVGGGAPFAPELVVFGERGATVAVVASQIGARQLEVAP